jgi:hypothetical protein
VKFFFDRNVSHKLARIINAFEQDHNVTHQDWDGRFTDDSEDVHIINTLAAEREKPVWITADLRQRSNAAERAALRSSGMTVFFLKRSAVLPHHQALKMLAVWPTLVESAQNARVPTAFEIPIGRIGAKFNTKITRLCNTSELT